MILRILKLFLGIIILSTGNLCAQNQNFTLIENGSEINLPDSVKKQIRVDEDDVDQILLKWFAADGYLNGKIDSIRNNRVYISRNCAYFLNELRIQYSGENDSLVIRKSDARYTQKNLQKEIDRLLVGNFYEGFPFAKGSIISINPDHSNCTVSVHLELDTGVRQKTSEIIFSGNETNSQAYLKKISRFKPGETLTPTYLRYLRSNLNNSEFFNFVGEGQILLNEGKPVVLFDVQERSLNQFDALLGYVPDVTGKGQIVGNLSLDLWNVVTEGNGLNFNYERLQAETSELDIGVYQEWIRDIPIGLSVDFSFYQNDTTYQSRQFEVGGTYRVSGGFRLTSSLGIQNSISGTNIMSVLEPDGSKRIARLGFEYTNLNRYDVPTSGNKLSVSYGVAKKEIEGDSTGVINQNILMLEAKQYFSVFERSVIALSIHGFLLEADRVTLNDLIRFGGANSFRGYAEEQFRAGQLLWGDIEYQFLVDRQSYLFVFAAMGGYHRPKLLGETDNQFKTTNSLYATGLGISYQTRLGRLKFTYAISPEESIGNGKVHFGIRAGL